MQAFSGQLSREISLNATRERRSSGVLTKKRLKLIQTYQCRRKHVRQIRIVRTGDNNCTAIRICEIESDQLPARSDLSIKLQYVPNFKLNRKLAVLQDNAFCRFQERFRCREDLNELTAATN
jgi:hypothetical protein